MKKVAALKTSLSYLSKSWLEAKAAEDNARNWRISLEQEMESLIPGPEEGSATKTEDHYKITLTRKYTRTIDHDICDEAIMRGLVPSDIIRYKPELNMKVLRAIETANPAAFKACEKFITIKPAKTAVKVEEVE